MSSIALARILNSLVPSTTEELKALCSVLAFAERYCIEAAGSGMELLKSFGSLPQEAQDNLYHLIEAATIYQRIHGRPVPREELKLGDSVFHELRQIRDMCSNRSFRAVF